MKLTYENTKEHQKDLATIHHYITGQYSQDFFRFKFIGLFIAFIIIISDVASDTFVFGKLLILLISSLAWFFFSSNIYLESIHKNIQALNIQNKTHHFFCTHTMTLSPESISDETEYTNHVIKTGGIEKIHLTGKYIFIYITANSAHVIPLKEIESEHTPEEIIAFVNQHYADKVVEIDAKTRFGNSTQDKSSP